MGWSAAQPLLNINQISRVRHYENPLPSLGYTQTIYPLEGRPRPAYTYTNESEEVQL